MTRTMPDFPEGDLAINNHHPDMETRTYEIQVITPLFGGGVEAGKIDPELPIRPSSIRGHLRFWWRATRGAKFADGAELRQRESEIWGSTENPSPVCLEITDVSQGKPYPCAYYPEGRNFPRFEVNHPPYALFPFQGSKNDGTPVALCLPDVKFRLKFVFPKELSPDVESALWAWINFGGIGARTRRGCGALFCQDFSPSDYQSISDWYNSFSMKFEVDHPGENKWPTLPKKILVRQESSNEIQCWAVTIELMRVFRQGDVGRNPGKPRPGRSRWPEPETIREATRCRNPKHTRMAIPNDAFPRAEFGLPIIFQFTPRGSGDPAETELYPVVNNAQKTRMSSPLILRPMRCANGDVVSIILHLQTPRLDEVILKNAPHNPRYTKIRGKDLASYHNSPMGLPKGGNVERSADGSALDAFIAFAQEKGNDFVEVPK